jgi:tetratricopeptide (TPR) repeat protein
MAPAEGSAVSDEVSEGFSKIAETVIRELFENIGSGYVYMPLALFVLLILAYPITRYLLFLYLSLVFVMLAFAADWIGRWRNQRTPALRSPEEPGYRDEIFAYLSSVQRKAVDMLEEGKKGSGRVLTEKNLKAVDEALKSYPGDADFYALMGYTLKDMYQSSKDLLSADQREAYLSRAEASFAHSLNLDPKNASAHNGMGNVLFFQGRYDEAIREHESAIKLAGGQYPEAEHDLKLVIAVKKERPQRSHAHPLARE